MNFYNPKPDDEDATLPFVVSQMPDFIVTKAEKELNETSENKTHRLLELKEMIKDSKAINGIDFHDDFLVNFLRNSKYDVPKAFNQLQNNVSMKKKKPKYFETMSKKDFAKICSCKLATCLPRRCPDGCAIVIVNVGNINPSEISIDDLFQYLIVLFTQSLRDPLTQVCGFKIIYVFKNASPRFLWQFTPQKAWFYYSAGMNAFPARYKEIHFVDESIVMKTIWFVVKNFMSEKMKKRVNIHSSPEKLLDFFPASVLPEEYGGEVKNYFMTEWNSTANQQTGECTLGGHANFF